MNSHILKSLVASALLALLGSVQAQELKIGYVNSDRVLREADPAKAAQAKLEAEFGEAREGPERPRKPLKTASRQARQGRADARRSRADAAPARARRAGPRPAAQAPRVPGGPEPAQERRAGGRRRAGQPGHQADLRDREVRPDPAGRGVLQPARGHHRQGDRGAQRPRRPGSFASRRWAKSLRDIIAALGGELIGDPATRIDAASLPSSGRTGSDLLPCQPALPGAARQRRGGLRDRRAGAARGRGGARRGDRRARPVSLLRQADAVVGRAHARASGAGSASAPPSSRPSAQLGAGCRGRCIRGRSRRR